MFLLDLGVNPAAMDNYDMTALHWAGANGMLDVIDDLLRRGVPLEAENVWGGTVLNSTLHFALYIPVTGVDYVPVLERSFRRAQMWRGRLSDREAGDRRVARAVWRGQQR